MILKDTLKFIVSPKVDGYIPRGALKFKLSPLVDGYILRDASKFIKSFSGWMYPNGRLEIYWVLKIFFFKPV